MKIGDKIKILDTGEIGVVHRLDGSGNAKLVKVGDKIVDVAGKAIEVLGWIVKAILFFKSLFGNRL